MVYLFFYLKVTNGLKEIKIQVNPIFSLECNLRINSKDKEWIPLQKYYFSDQGHNFDWLIYTKIKIVGMIC